MKRILLVNPPIFDFSAYDFWLKPYGVLRVGGYLRDRAELRLFDFLDRFHPSVSGQAGVRADSWGRGKFPADEVEKPSVLMETRRRFRRYGLSTEVFAEFLQSQPAFDVALIQTSMTYWYPGVSEVLDTIRRIRPTTKTVLGGVYATICPQHAATLGADFVVSGSELAPLWEYLDLQPDSGQPPF
ncbi:MAG TPA: cobalamin-dependent protein, partial [Acidobacteriota bacterium]|nr:cobalamin-dependent protein [Acidobacteriota bacterium]